MKWSHPERQTVATPIEPYSSQKHVREMLFDPITMDPGTFESRLDSATPGDPDHIFMSDNTPYSQAALDYMLSKLDDLESRVGSALETGRGVEGLLPKDYQAIEREIRLQHEAQSSKNQASFDRLVATYTDDPDSIGEWKAIFVKLTRSVDADTILRLCLLDWYPEMGSIEDLKRTCLADYPAYERAQKDYVRSLRGLHIRSSGRFSVELINKEDLRPRPRDLTDVAPEQVEADKTTIARIIDNVSHREYEVVEKFSQYSFPVTQLLEGVRPHIVDGVNKQPIYLQIYLALDTSRNHLDASGNLRPRDPSYIGRAGLAREVWEARKAKELEKLVS